MIHLRIVAPEQVSAKAIELLEASPAVLNVVHHRGADSKPDGDLILCDVACEEASAVGGRRGRGEGRARPALGRRPLGTELSFSFAAFMVLAMQIAGVGILFDQPILIVGAMVVGPEFGPLAGLAVALVNLRADARAGARSRRWSSDSRWGSCWPSARR